VIQASPQSAYLLNWERRENAGRTPLQITIYHRKLGIGLSKEQIDEKSDRL
jgi:hypothetical protein